MHAEEILNIDLDTVLLDLVFDESKPNILQGMEMLNYIRIKFPELPIIIMTNHSSTEITVKAIKSGAVDFINKKELDWSEWKNRLRYYCKKSQEYRLLCKKYEELESKHSDSEIMGISKEIDSLRLQIKDLAEHSREIPILLTGETGTGKNLAVKYFRKFSPRNRMPFREFSILELSETLLESELFGHTKGAFTGAEKDKKGLFEECEGGILFLDEIGDYDIKIQKKLLRFLEEKTITQVGSTRSRTIDVQLIVATNQNIPKLISEGKFREDLYQRINRIRIELPPLRQRKIDIQYLTDYFLRYYTEKEKINIKSISSEVYELFKRYDWPGNVRELQSVIWEACTKARLYHSDILKGEHLRDEILKSNTEKQIINEKSMSHKIAIVELEAIEKALEKVHGNKTEAAKILNLSLDQLRYKVLKCIQNDKSFLKGFMTIEKEYGYLLKG
jgi:DNA-binding NtrC family response regulator